MYIDIARSALTQLAQVAMSARMSLSNLWISVPGSLAGFMWFIPKHSLPCLEKQWHLNASYLRYATYVYPDTCLPPTV